MRYYIIIKVGRERAATRREPLKLRVHVAELREGFWPAFHLDGRCARALEDGKLPVEAGHTLGARGLLARGCFSGSGDPLLLRVDPDSVPPPGSHPPSSESESEQSSTESEAFF